MLEPYLFNNLSYVMFLIFIMFISKIFIDYNTFNPIFNKLSKIKDTRISLFLFSLVAGSLPIPGRVTVTAGLLDTIVSKDSKNYKDLGIIDYLSSHHYYLWSPLEKTIIIPMAVLGISYFEVLSYLWPLLLFSTFFIFINIYKLPKDGIIFLKFSERKSNLKDTFLIIGFILSIICISFINPALSVIAFSLILILSYKIPFQKIIKIIKDLNWNLVLILTFVIILGNIIKSYNLHDSQFINNSWMLAGIFSFIVSFLLGSSSRFSGIVAYLTSIFGVHYFVFFFAMDFAAYLISPMHKCSIIGKMYFNTPLLKYYLVLGIWGLSLIVLSLILI